MAEFREIETLYDAGQLAAFGVVPQWPRFGPYNQNKFGGFMQAMGFTQFLPKQTVTWKELLETLRALPESADPAQELEPFYQMLIRNSPLAKTPLNPEGPVTRGQASSVLSTFFSPQQQ
jgi:hypothetical protein